MLKSRLKEIRAKNNISLQEISAATGIGYPTVQKLDAGDPDVIESMKLGKILPIAKLLGVGLWELIEEQPDEHNPILEKLREYKRGEIREVDVLRFLETMQLEEEKS